MIQTNPNKQVKKYHNKKPKKKKKRTYNKSKKCKYHSIKIKEWVVCNSTYELIHLKNLDKDKTVERFEYEPLEIEYFSSSGKKHKYVPDFVVYYTDGRVEIQEVKSCWKLKHKITKIKTKIGKELVEDPETDYTAYKIYTEKELF